VTLCLSSAHRFSLKMCFALIALLCLSNRAQAVITCTSPQLGNALKTASPSVNYNPSAPLGTIVWRGPLWSGSVTCTSPTPNPINLPIALLGGATNGGLFAPNLEAGVEVDGVNQGWSSMSSGATATYKNPTFMWPAGQTSVTFNITVQLLLRIATGKVGGWSGGIAWSICPVQTNGSQGGNGCSSTSLSFAMFPGGSLNPVIPTCNYQTKNVAFPLGSVQSSSLSNAGDASSWVDGNLISNGCDAVTQLTMSFNAAADADDPSLFQAQGGATGVGIQLQTGSQGSGVQITPGGKLNVAPQASGGAYPFSARYVRTTAPISPGKGNANITVNITYQ
jgi:type 1 fimbria pilin